MREVIRIGLILIVILMLLNSLGFGGQLETGLFPMETFQEETSDQGILPRNGDLWFSSWNGEASAIPGIDYPRQSPEAIAVPKRELSHFDEGLIQRGKSGYHSEKIHLTKTDLDSPLEFISILSVAQYKEENAPSWLSERFKEEDIFKSLAVFFELQLKF